MTEPEAAQSGLGSTGGRATLLVLWATVVVYAAIARSAYLPIPAALSLLAYLVTSLTLTVRIKDPLPLRPTLLIVVSALIQAICATLSMTGPNQEPWLLFASVNMLALLCVRGRSRFAAVGVLGYTVIVIGFRDHVVTLVGSLLLTGVATLAVGIACRRTVEHFTSRGAQHDIELESLRVLQASAERASRESQQQVDEVAARVIPLLARARRTQAVDESLARALGLEEALVRDMVRAHGLAVEPVREATTRARHRGVTVRLFDDRDSAEPVPASMLRRIAEVLDRTTCGSVSVRLLPAWHEANATITVSDGQSERLSAL